VCAAATYAEAVEGIRATIAAYALALDDGRSAVVTQYDNPGFRPGDRVMIRNSHLVMLR